MKQYPEVIDPARRVSTLDRPLLGSFLEHLGRAMYTGIYEPGSPHGLERFPHRCDGRGPRPERSNRPLSGRKFCLRAPLAGRRSSQQILLLNRVRPLTERLFRDEP